MKSRPRVNSSKSPTPQSYSRPRTPNSRGSKRSKKSDLNRSINSYTKHVSKSRKSRTPKNKVRKNGGQTISRFMKKPKISMVSQSVNISRKMSRSGSKDNLNSHSNSKKTNELSAHPP
jgi:hypothetical protein